MPESGALLKPPGEHIVGTVRCNEPLCLHANWEIGGPADYLLEPASPAQLAAGLQWIRENSLPFAIIGDGTNILFPDEGFRGAIIKIGRRMSSHRIEGMTIDAQAGAWIPSLARIAAAAGIGGMEHTIGIPGTLGGLVLMNGGSLRKSIGTMVRRVWALDREGNEHQLDHEECAFEYRKSALQSNGLIVTRVLLEGTPRDPGESRREMLDIIRKRRLKFPKKLPNCGSVFISRPEMYDTYGPPGKIIEETGLKGTRIGGAMIPDLHANFIVNAGGATAADIKSMVRLVREKVHARTGFWMICEVRTLLPDGSFRPVHEVL
ncbi:MAG: UDP-N-acetylmuramate dehydrogenase [Candidatus Sumerlaeota bacterium]|nr:UDP-N-acetylmuramate dehydrogenase [Candidatus Sumerlaeota bacterium]